MNKIKRWKDAMALAEKAAEKGLRINYYDDSTGIDDPDPMIMIIEVVGMEVDHLGRELMKVLIHNDGNGHDRYTRMTLEEIADLFWNNRKHINKFIQEVRA